MNNELQNYAREQLKSGLKKCTEGQQRLFKQMYAHKNMDKDIDYAVDNMPEDKLDFAMQQVKRTLEKKTQKIEPVWLLPRQDTI